MANITATQIAELRKKTGLPMMECKKALVEANGDEAKAMELLRKKGASRAESKAERTTKAGLIESYVHGGKIGVLVEVLVETDFVVKNEEFKTFVHDVALHIAASNPLYISEKDVPAQKLEEEMKVFESQVESEGKPAEIVKKIVEGKMAKFLSEICLLNQPYIKNPDQTVGELLTALISKIGENIVISRFTRFEIGK